MTISQTLSLSHPLSFSPSHSFSFSISLSLLMRPPPGNLYPFDAFLFQGNMREESFFYAGSRFISSLEKNKAVFPTSKNTGYITLYSWFWHRKTWFFIIFFFSLVQTWFIKRNVRLFIYFLKVYPNIFDSFYLPQFSPSYQLKMKWEWPSLAHVDMVWRDLTVKVCTLVKVGNVDRHSLYHGNSNRITICMKRFIARKGVVGLKILYK